MKHDKFLKRVSAVFSDNLILKFAIFIIGVATVFNAIYVGRKLNEQRTILVPPQINQRMWISGSTASDEYLVEFARHIASLAFSYHPATVRAQFDELTRLFIPGEYDNARKVFYALANRIEETRVSSTFYILPDGIKIWKNRTIEIRGLKTTLFPDKLSEETQMSYFIDFTIVNGKFGIVSILDKEGIDQREAENAKK